jgi:ABC-type multidrug transport system fused ATPase/permease subunit
MGAAALAGHLPLARFVTFASAAIGTSMIAFGGLSWALDGTAAPIAAVLRLEGNMKEEGALTQGHISAEGMPAREIRFRNVTFAYPHATEPVLGDFDLTIPAGSSLAIVGQNGAGKTTIAKLLCRLYDPQQGAIEVDGTDIRALDIDGWRSRVTAVFQDFIRFELSLRENVAPAGAPDNVIRQVLEESGAAYLARLDTVLARGYPDSTDLSGGQWQRVALARALFAVDAGARVLILDEPTAALDVRAEAEIYERFLELTAGLTTILISHRFSTVRRADRIIVLDNGIVVEDGSHDELLAQEGRYARMFDLQAARFVELEAGHA